MQFIIISTFFSWSLSSSSSPICDVFQVKTVHNVKRSLSRFESFCFEGAESLYIQKISHFIGPTQLWELGLVAKNRSSIGLVFAVQPKLFAYIQQFHISFPEKLIVDGGWRINDHTRTAWIMRTDSKS